MKKMKNEAKVKKSELCGIEFFSQKECKRFLALNPMLQMATRLIAGNRILILAKMPGFPTRDILEIYNSQGRTIGKLIGPDALLFTYQIRLTEAGEIGGYHPEAFL